MDRHVVDALARLVLDHVQHHARRDVRRLLDALNDLVNGHGADRNGRHVDDRLTDGIDVPAGGQVHHRVCAQVDGGVQLLELVVDLARDGGVADIGVDLALCCDADRPSAPVSSGDEPCWRG